MITPESTSLPEPNTQARARTALPYAIAMFAFIVTITVLADVDHHNPLFDTVRNTPYGDKVCHFLFFGVFAFFVHRALDFRAWTLLGLRIPAGPLVILCAATLEELSQRYFPQRTLDIVDWLADFGGIALFTWLAQRNAPKSRV